jgi:hypothetical protein
MPMFTGFSQSRDKFHDKIYLLRLPFFLYYIHFTKKVNIFFNFRVIFLPFLSLIIRRKVNTLGMQEIINTLKGISSILTAMGESNKGGLVWAEWGLELINTELIRCIEALERQIEK